MKRAVIEMNGENNPRYGQYGDPRPRCQWCGSADVRGSHTFQFGEYGYFCSYNCEMAGRYHQMIGLVFVGIPFFVVTSTILLFIPNMPILFPIIYIPLSLLFSIWMVNSVRVGHSMRKVTVDGYIQRGELDEDVAIELEETILDFIKMKNEVTLSEIISHFGETYSVASIRWVIDRLLVTGSIAEEEMGHYRAKQ